MKKRLVSILLAVCLLLCVPLSASGASSLSNFRARIAYRNQFTDILPEAWYYDDVRGAFEYGIMDGKSPDTFDPSGSVTIAEAIKLAACLHKGFHTGQIEFGAGSPWYAPYVDYALKNDIIAGEYNDYTATATRSDFAVVIAAALPDEAVTPINRVVDGVIPDVWEYYTYGSAVYKLYRAGVLTGNDSKGTFYPGRSLQRAEAATIIMRLINADRRQSLRLENPLAAEQIYELASHAVFHVELFDSDGNNIKNGSGFFISEDGLAATNYHVVIGAYSARITMFNGDIYDVEGIYDYNWKNDIALIKIDVEGAPYLECADSSKVMTGARVYTIGSPLGLEGSFSTGIVSQAVREIDGINFIQLDAPISSGSSGGALLDSSGRAIGVTCATMISAQNINLAMPINLFDDLNHDNFVPLDSIMEDMVYYEDFYPAPDFGAIFNVPLFKVEETIDGTAHSYSLADLPGDADEIIDAYTLIVEQNLFVHTSVLTSRGFEYDMYYNSQFDVLLMFGKDVVGNQECFTITIS